MIPGRFTDPRTVLKCYQQPDTELVRDALEQRSAAVNRQ